MLFSVNLCFSFSGWTLSLKFCSIAVFKRVCGTVSQYSYAVAHPLCRCSLCWQELFGWCELMLFGQINPNYRQKNVFY